ncbi:hypothetical protein [Paracoccus sp. DMF]|uniref:hypothetical protein n=1 Tax=Paracoccus sp. DMF TaxID=400837 RepID=UPI0011045C76|nr:hypothetical protein [Paracoccus sp. DMF]MCV2448469.1 hypothetical protein [Paracoccus sp. DMF]
MKIQTVTGLVAENSAGQVVDVPAYRLASPGETDIAGRPVDVIEAEESAGGVPMRFATGKAAQNIAGQWVDTIPVSFGARPPESRAVLAGTEGLGFSAHSFLYQAVAPGDFGDLGAYWTGGLHINYAEFSSLGQRWDANGSDRTAEYDGALIVTEIGDLETGLADPASPQGIDTLQHLYWYALTAQAKGCKLLGIYIPHSPEGVNIDADALEKVQYWLDWLRARPEITIPVYAIPAPVMVRAMVDQFAPTSIYADGLHLRTPAYPAPNQMNNAMGQMVRMFLTGARSADDPSWNAELVGLVDTAWGILQAYEMTGLGGDTVVAPYPVAADPLPNPDPLP